MSLSDVMAVGIGVGGLALAALNLWLVYKTIRSQWLSNSATLVAWFEQEFGSDKIIQSRNKLAVTIRQEIQLPKKDHVLTGYWPVLSLYDVLGAMIRRKAIDEELSWNRFGWRIVRCHLALVKRTDLLKKTREIDESTLYEQFDWLGKRWIKRYESHVKRLDPENATEEYLAQEITLTSESTKKKRT